MTALPNTDGIYLISLSEDLAVAPTSIERLSHEERLRAQAISHPLARRRFEMGRFFLRGLLGARLGLEPAAVPIRISGNGKPELALGPRVPPCHFSLSHSSNWIAIALSEQPVGLDLETRCPPTWKTIASRFFSDFEQSWIAQAASSEAAFAMLWTMKEAAVKLSAQTLLPGLRGFSLIDVKTASPVSSPQGPIAVSNYLPAAGCWLSSAVVSRYPEKDEIFPIYESAGPGGWSLNEHIGNQYLMSGFSASDQN